MAKPTLEQAIEKARAEFQESPNRIAFLGEVSSGKTVVAALLNYTLSKSWIPKTNGKWEAVPKSGEDEINETMRKMKKGEFATVTPRANYPETVITIHRMEGNPTKFDLTLHDMSGENYSDYLTSPDYANIDERLLEILEKNGAYLAFAKKYVIMIDCENRDEWDTDISKVASMITRLREIKQKIHNYDEDEKLHTPIAIIFTKADLLSPEDQAKPIEELAKEYHRLMSSLNANHDKENLKFFKVSVSTVTETPEEAQSRVKRRDEEIKTLHEEKLRKWDEQIQASIEQAVAAAKQQAQTENQPDEEVNRRVSETQKQTQLEYREQFDQKNPIPINKEEPEPKSRIIVPLEYTGSEYSKLISWILDVNDGT